MNVSVPVICSFGCSIVSSSLLHVANFHACCGFQIAAYDMEIVRAVRSSELERLGELKREGRSMDACNRFGESVLHMACRRGSTEMVQFLTHECDLGVNISDDFGRTPLHGTMSTRSVFFFALA